MDGCEFADWWHDLNERIYEEQANSLTCMECLNSRLPEGELGYLAEQICWCTAHEEFSDPQKTAAQYGCDCFEVPPGWSNTKEVDENAIYESWRDYQYEK